MRPMAAALTETGAFRTRPNRKLVIGAVAALVIAIVVLTIVLLPRQGSVVVAISGPGGRQVDSVQIFVDGKKVCDTSPCVAASLPAGTHFVKVAAPGYATPAPKPVKVSGGEEALVPIELAIGGAGTGVKVTAEGSGLVLSVDGKEVGPLPQEIKDMSPGEHSIRVAGNDRYEPYEETVTVVPDQIKVIGPLKLKVLRGLAVIEPGQNAERARVMLVSGDERRTLPKIPLKIDIKTDKTYQLIATRRGFETFETPITFDDGQAERKFVIDLRPEAESEPAAPSRSTRSVRTPSVSHAAPAAATGKGKLNINSIPASNVLLDGRPLGSTPKAGVSVSAGTHTVVFVNPKYGRKVVSLKVGAGKTATAAVRFP